MRKTTKFLSMLLAIVMCVALFACGGGGGGAAAVGEGDIEITIMNTDGGVGRAWLDNAAARFVEAVKDKEYAGGKKGVKIDISENEDTGVQTMNTAGYNIYFDSGTSTTLSLSQSGFLVNINDIVKEKLTEYGEDRSIEDKIEEEYRATCVGADGNYYALPHFALHPGLTYDAELFEKEDMYLAAPDAAEADKDVYVAGKVEDGTYIGTATFAKTSENPNAKKSCGNDGKYGTADDGLPTSMVEFFILCDRLSYNEIEPIALSGGVVGYATYLFDALYASLSGGYEAANTRYTFNGKGTFVKETDSFDMSTPVWSGFDIEVAGPKPNTEEITLSRGDNGYRSNDNVARYYAISALKILEEMDWLSGNSRVGTVSHVDAMEDFIFAGKLTGQPKQAMFIEGDYWYNEAMENGKVANYKKKFPDAGDRKLAWMSLPTHAYESVTGAENARPFVMVNTASCYSFINANIENDEALLQACKDFLQFCYTDQELSYFTGLTGVAKAGLDYDVLDEHSNLLSYYHKSLLEVRRNNNTIILNATEDPLYNESFVCCPTIDGTKYGNYLTLMRAKDYTVNYMFEQTRTKKAGWGVVNP